MLELRTNFNGVQQAEKYVANVAAAYPSAARKGLTRIIRGMHRVSMDKLNGRGGAGRTAQIVGPSRGFTKASGETVNFKQQFAGAGGYPVPVRTGNLKRLLDFVEPGQSKSGAGFNVHAGPLEAILYNSAEYANTIHEGLGSSAKFGPRRFLIDALEQYKQGEMAAILEEELQLIV